MLIAKWCAEWCAVLFGGTARSSRARVLVTLSAVLLIGYSVAVLTARFEAMGFLLGASIVPFALVGARKVFRARDDLWRAASLPLDDPRELPRSSTDHSLAPTALALTYLAWSVDAARRNKLLEANELAAKADCDLLRPDETRLYAAVCAIASLGLAKDRDAAANAIRALPSGSEELDAMLGRALLRAAWQSDARVAAIDSAWETSGVAADASGSLPRLRQLIRVRIDCASADALPMDEARALAAEAEAIGDGDLSADLAARGRGSRIYR